MILFNVIGILFFVHRITISFSPIGISLLIIGVIMITINKMKDAFLNNHWNFLTIIQLHMQFSHSFLFSHYKRSSPLSIAIITINKIKLIP